MSLSEILPDLLLGLTSVGFAAAFLFVEPRSPTTRSLSLAFFANGWEWAETPWCFRRPIPGLRYFDLLVIVTAGIAFAEWLHRVARTAQTTARAMMWITRCVRVVQGAAVLTLLMGCLDVNAVYENFFEVESLDAVLASPLLTLFALLLAIATIAYVCGGAILFFQRVDPVEHVRALALVIAIPFFSAGVVLSPSHAVLSNLVGQLVFLVGALRYHAMQGERGRFMGSFLSPEVARLVRLKGMAYVMQPQTLEITAVACDLRGFTAFSRAHPSGEVVKLLGEYYEAVGSVVAKFGATIKDYAGDGILVLVGAPVVVADHADVGLQLARDVVAAAREVMRRWDPAGGALGVGAGVASGVVTAGAIGSPSRMEYTAVGSAINLASRLCSQASDGEVLVDERTAQLKTTTALVSRGDTEIKGVGNVPHFALA